MFVNHSRNRDAFHLFFNFFGGGGQRKNKKDHTCASKFKVPDRVCTCKYMYPGTGNLKYQGQFSARLWKLSIDLCMYNVLLEVLASTTLPTIDLLFTQPDIPVGSRYIGKCYQVPPKCNFLCVCGLHYCFSVYFQNSPIYPLTSDISENATRCRQNATFFTPWLEIAIYARIFFYAMVGDS